MSFFSSKLIYLFELQYKMFDSQSNITRDLMKPIQQAYTQSGNKCFGTLDKVLFKQFLQN